MKSGRNAFLLIDRSNIIGLLISVLGIILNVSAMLMVGVFHQPVYLNTIGTLLATCECGTIYGISVALLSNLVMGLFYDQSLYYSIVNISVAVFAGILFHFHITKTNKGKLYLILGLGVISGILGGHIDYALMGRPDHEILAFLTDTLCEKTGLGYLTSLTIAGVFFSILDKAITVGIVYALAYLINKFVKTPRREREEKGINFENVSWDKKSRSGYRRRILLIISMDAVALTVAISWISLSIYSNMIRTDRVNAAIGAAKQAADAFDPTLIDSYLKKGGPVKEASSSYQKANRVLYSIKNNTPSLEYLYIYQMREDGIRIVFDTDPSFYSDGIIGEKLEYEDAFREYLPELLSGKPISVIENNDKYGWFLTAYNPIYNVKGECVAYSGADVSMTDLRDYSNAFLLRVLLIASSFLTAMLAFGLRLSGKYHKVLDYQYDQIRASKEEADKANHAKSIFLANMSHEIRTPINTINGMNELILRENTDGVPKAYSDTILEHSRDIKAASGILLQLINDILDLSKIESGKMEVDCEEYNLNDELKSIIRMVRVRATEKGLGFSTVIDPELPTVLYGDRGKIRQILINLLSNAIKHTREGGFNLSVTCVEKSDKKCRIHYSVKDTGIGIKLEDMDKIFEAFERTDRNRNSQIQGTGLGLNIAQKFALLMGGKIECNSKYGEGSDFFFTLEQEIVEETVIGQFDDRITEENKKQYKCLFSAPKGKVLVVDDNDMNLQVIKGLLRPTRLQVTLVSGGRECLEELEKTNYDIVLLDHMMPVMDGIETVKRIRKFDTELPVIALTANVMSGGVDFYRSAGFTDYLSKPVEGADLEKMIYKYLPERILEEPVDYYGTDKNNEACQVPDEEQKILDKAAELVKINLEDGFKYTGSSKAYIKFLKTFTKSADQKSQEIRGFLEEKDIENYTIKVHALKSTSRMIGARELSSMAEQLEMAGKEQDITFIEEHTEAMLEKLAAYNGLNDLFDNME